MGAVARRSRATAQLAADDRARPVEQHVMIGLGRQPQGRQPGYFSLVIGPHRIAVDGRRPEARERSRMICVDDDSLSFAIFAPATSTVIPRPDPGAQRNFGSMKARPCGWVKPGHGGGRLEVGRRRPKGVLTGAMTQASEIRPKKLFIKTYGCQMNVYDSDRMADALAPHGYEPTPSMDDADLVVLNTCHIREKASEKVFSELGRLAELRAEGRNFMVGVAGCVAQAEGEEIARRAKGRVDMVFGPQSYHRLPDLIARAERGEMILETEFPEEDKFEHLPAATNKVIRGRGLTAFLTVQEGCDKFCSFCVVPLYARRRNLAAGRAGAGRSPHPRRSRGPRTHAARPERQRLSRPRCARPALSGLASSAPALPNSPASPASAIRRRIRPT